MAKNKEEYYVGLDVGSSKITMVVGQPDEEGVLSVIGVGTSHLTGIKKGVIAEIEETVSGISEAMEMAEGSLGAAISSVTANINGGHISSQNSHGVVAVGRADQEITRNDLIRAEDAAQAIQIPSNKEISHVVPRFFLVDGGEKVKDPLGMTGVRLEVETHIITVSQQAAKNLSKAILQAGVGLDDLIVSPLAAAKAVLKKRQRELGCVLVDIGANTTGMTVFEDDSILYTTVFPIGSASVTNDIAIGLRTSIDVAEKVKVKYASAVAAEYNEVDRVDLSEIDLKEEGVYTKKHISEIAQARMEEILYLVRDELRRIGRDTLLPAGVIITGGGANIKNLEPLAKDVFRLPVEIAKPSGLGGMTNKVYDPAFSTAIGLMLYSYEEGTKTGGSRELSSSIDQIKKIFKIFLP
jgi:cell division protein FtsA